MSELGGWDLRFWEESKCGERHTRETRDLEKYGFCFNWFWKM